MLWNDILQESTKTGFHPSQILQEQLQKAVLAVLSHRNAFHHIVFQGGTSLRLFYGNPRFSEDLDFVLFPPTTSYDLSKHLSTLTTDLHSYFPFLHGVTASKQKSDDLLQRYALITASKNSDQRVRLHVELAHVPSHDSTLKILSFPPLQPAVRVETTKEILADKLLALANRPYIKGRDLWDIYYLITTQHEQPSWDLVWKKAADYHAHVPTLHKKLQHVSVALETQGTQLLSTELQRFLPPSTFAMYQKQFSDIITLIIHMLKNDEREPS